MSIKKVNRILTPSKVCKYGVFSSFNFLYWIFSLFYPALFTGIFSIDSDMLFFLFFVFFYIDMHVWLCLCLLLTHHSRSFLLFIISALIYKIFTSIIWINWIYTYIQELNFFGIIFGIWREWPEKILHMNKKFQKL